MSRHPASPWFADGSDSDPQRRMVDVERFAQEFFRSNTLSLMRRLSPEESEDLKREIVLHCIDDHFRVLKQFRQTGANFDAWFCTVCLNKAKDFLKSRTRYQQMVTHDLSADQLTLNRPKDGAPSPEDAAHLRQIVEAVNRGIESLDRYCRLLVRMDGEEFKPREMVRVLRWPLSKAKKISDDLAYCKEKLRILLAQQGIVDM